MSKKKSTMWKASGDNYSYHSPLEPVAHQYCEDMIYDGADRKFCDNHKRYIISLAIKCRSGTNSAQVSFASLARNLTFNGIANEWIALMKPCQKSPPTTTNGVEVHSPHTPILITVYRPPRVWIAQHDKYDAVLFSKLSKNRGKSGFRGRWNNLRNTIKNESKNESSIAWVSSTNQRIF